MNCLCLSKSEYLPSGIRRSAALQQELGNIQAAVLGGHVEGSEAFLRGDKPGRNTPVIVTVLKINAVTNGKAHHPATMMHGPH